ncbi:MAG: hypothetical protein AT715_02220 [Thermoproteus sp. JCHS_4]|jgi:hypothetical protein|nr:MAG: hypothetical protein AT715_02220 [Thermoproteus sp. JCHS_4]
MSLFLTLSELENILASLKDHAEHYRNRREALAAMEERYLKFVELAKAFGVELKLAEGVELYTGGELPDNTELLERINKALATVRRIKQSYGDLKVIVDIQFNLNKIIVKI